jgi:hypothetical protein
VRKTLAREQAPQIPMRELRIAYYQMKAAECFAAAEVASDALARDELLGLANRWSLLSLRVMQDYSREAPSSAGMPRISLGGRSPLTAPGLSQDNDDPHLSDDAE